jgi:hypothetical protein
VCYVAISSPLLAPFVLLAESRNVQQAAGFSAKLWRDSPNGIRDNPGTSGTRPTHLLALLLVLERPGKAGTNIMLTHIQIASAKRSAISRFPRHSAPAGGTSLSDLRCATGGEVHEFREVEPASPDLASTGRPRFPTVICSRRFSRESLMVKGGQGLPAGAAISGIGLCKPCQPNSKWRTKALHP